jgi:uncharacterized protein (TIGR02757 family)
MTRISLKNREAIILGYYQQFHRTQYLEWDPLSIVRQHLGTRNAEYVALVSALFAFGGVKQIIVSVKNAIERRELSKENWILNLDHGELKRRLHGFTHRIYVGEDLVALTLLYQRSFKEFGGLGEHFVSHHRKDSETIESGLIGLISDYKSWASDSSFQAGKHFKHMLNSPEQGSTCKRWLMYLKWMVRRDDGIDLGLWEKHPEVRPDQLLIPLDTHLFKISKKLGLTNKKTANWNTSIEVTRNLKRIDPIDPTRFDFSLCRFGMFDYRKILDKV